MKRWHEEYERTRREWKKHRKRHVEQNKDWSDKVGVSAYVVDCECDEQKGRFRKTKAFDCGNPRCYICHSDKFPKRDITYQEWCADLALKEWLDELDSRHCFGSVVCRAQTN